MLCPIADRVAGVIFRRQEPLFLQKHYNAALAAGIGSIIKPLTRPYADGLPLSWLPVLLLFQRREPA
jgi:hypothetical protein